jgi:hypothetical protein
MGTRTNHFPNVPHWKKTIWRASITETAYGYSHDPRMSSAHVLYWKNWLTISVTEYGYSHRQCIFLMFRDEEINWHVLIAEVAYGYPYEPSPPMFHTEKNYSDIQDPSNVFS